MVINKKGQELTLGTIILIVLGVLVLIFLIYGFSSGWSNLWKKIAGVEGKTNVDDIRSACELACSRGEASKYSYCQENRSVILSDNYKGTWNCKSLETQQVFCKSEGDCKSEVVLLNKCSEISC